MICKFLFWKKTEGQNQKKNNFLNQTHKLLQSEEVK